MKKSINWTVERTSEGNFFSADFYSGLKANFATDVTADFTAQTSANVNFPPTYVVIFMTDFTFELISHRHMDSGIFDRFI